MSLFHYLCAQHVSDINISIIRSFATVLLNYHIGRLVLSSLCVGDLVWLGLSGARIIIIKTGGDDGSGSDDILSSIGDINVCVQLRIIV